MDISEGLKRLRYWLAFLDQVETDLQTKLERQRGDEKSQPLMTAASLSPPPPPRPARPPVPPPTTAPEETTPAALPQHEADPTLANAVITLGLDEEKPAPPVDEDGDWVSELVSEMDAIL